MQSTIGPKRGKDRGHESRVSDSLVMFESVDGIIRGANRHHAKLFQDSLNSQMPLRKLFVCTIPDLFRAVLIEQFIDPKIALQFKMGPVVKRIAKCMWHGSRPGEELLIRLGISRAVPLWYSICTHRAPFIVISLKPDFREIAETMIVRDLFRRKMAVIIQDRLIGSVLTIQMAGGFCPQQKVFRNESHIDDLTKISTISCFRLCRCECQTRYYIGPR